MHINEPDNAAPIADAPAPADAPAAADPPAPAPEAPADPAPSLEEGALAAVDAGLSASEAPAPDAAPDGIAEGDGAADPKPTKEDEGKPDDDGAQAPGAELSAEEEATSLGVKNERARERFKELREKADRLAALEEKLPEIEGKAAQYDQMIEHIEATGATPEQYAAALGYLRVIHHGTPAEKAQALDFLRQEIDWQQNQIGLGGDLLEKHPDLLDAVKNGDIARPYAEELARERALKQAQQQHVQTMTERQRQDQQAQMQAIESAKAELNTLGSLLSKLDPHFAAKVDAANAAFLQVRDSIPPSEWAKKYQLIYEGIPNPAPRPAPEPAKPPVGTVPLRPQGGAGMGRAPSSAADAIELGLSAYAAGRA